MAPPQHSREKASARISLVPSMPLTMSLVRTRVASRDWWASRQVVVADQQLLLRQHPVGHSLGALGVQQLLEAVGPVAGDRREPARLVHLVAVPLLHHDVRDVLEHLGGPVLALVQPEELRRLVDELGVAAPRQEGGVLEDVGDEGDVGLDAADVDLPDGAAGLQAHALEGVVPGGDLQQQGVIVGGDLTAHAGGGGVQPDAEAAGRAVGGDLSGVGGEVVGRVLGGDTALDGIAVQADIALLLDADCAGR